MCVCVCVRHSQRRQVGQCVEGSGKDGTQLVVIEREQTDVDQACEAAIVDTADLVVPQHPT